MLVACASSSAFLRHDPGGKLNCFHDAWIAAAAAEMSIHRLANCALSRLWLLAQQFKALDDHAVVAVATLRSLLVDHGSLQRVKCRCVRKIPLPRIERR